MHPADGERQEWLELLLGLLIKPENWAGMLIKRRKRNWESSRPHNEVPCVAIVILLTVMCLTINKIARCSLQPWEQSVIWERGLLPRCEYLCDVSRRWVMVLCRVSPCLHYHHVTPLSRYTSCLGSLQKKIKSYLSLCSHQDQAIIVTRELVYVCPWQASCLGLCCGFLIPAPPQPQVSGLTVPKCDGWEEEASLIPSGAHLTIWRE